MQKIMLSLAAAGVLLAACGDNAGDGADVTEGPVVSAPEAPRNEAVDTTPTNAGGEQTPGANSFTEAQARGAVESAGYTEVGALTQNQEGLWQGSAMKDGAEVNVSVDYRGEVTEQPGGGAQP
jgi:predicted small secreted protein